MTTRQRAWADRTLSGSVLAAGAAGLTINLLLNAPTVDTLTAIRVLLDFTVQYAVGSTIVDSLSVVSCGVGVTSVEAFTIGGTSLPSPADETQYPPRGWLYVASKAMWTHAESAGVTEVPAVFQVDIRSMRKIDKGVLFCTFVNNNITVGGSMTVTGRARALCLT